MPATLTMSCCRCRSFVVTRRLVVVAARRRLRRLSSIDTAAGFTAEVNNTTVANTGTAVTLHADTFNVRAGCRLWFPPENCPMASQANTTIVVRITAPADSLTMSGTLYVEELY